jgi:hypothetical protein
MNKNLLITFGCSWTYGVGVGYQIEQSTAVYNSIAWNSDICGTKSFRGVLSKNFALDNKNFAHGGSSNQAQFNYAKRYFSKIDFKCDQETYDKIIVLHAITSTARNVFFDLDTMSVLHCKYNMPNKFSEFMVKHSYDHNHEVQQLEVEMNFWNVFYKSMGVKNIWVDTFNHHLYHQPIDNMIDIPDRDLMSQLCLRNNMKNVDNNYHYSNWVVDSNRVAFLVDIGLLNPISHHPTEKAHIQIADFIAPMIESRL